MKEAIKLEEMTHGDLFYLGMFEGAAVTLAFRDDEEITLEQHGSRGPQAIKLDEDMAERLTNLLGDDRESQTIERLRADHDALNARYARLEAQHKEIAAQLSAMAAYANELEKAIDAALEKHHHFNEEMAYSILLNASKLDMCDFDTNATRELAAVASEAASDES